MAETHRKFDRDFRKSAVRLIQRLPVIVGQASGMVRSRSQRSPSTADQKYVSALLPLGVPQRRRSAAQQLGTNQASSSGHQAGHDRRSRKAFQPKLILW